jgi:EAL domain-containing protein (putative c-di-GMP-specific phosphodiesterase class I)
VLDTACRQGAVWQAEGHRFTIAVNVAAPQLARDRIFDDVQRALGRSGFDPTMLILEMTETALMSNVDEAIARFRILRAFGVRLAVDDFGTGYSSLAYLREFPIDVLKIDRSFVSEIGASEESSALVEMLVQLGKSLGLEIVAEGIEDDIQRLWLLSQGVDTGQGFLFSRPLEVGAVNPTSRAAGDQLRRPEIVLPDLLARGAPRPADPLEWGSVTMRRGGSLVGGQLPLGELILPVFLCRVHGQVGVAQQLGARDTGVMVCEPDERQSPSGPGTSTTWSLRSSNSVRRALDITAC